MKRFPEKSQGLSNTKRRAILDGMLFEIFFDAEGELREQPKTNWFSEVFDLEAFAEFKPCFEFIASALAPNASRYFALPGKGISVTVDVTVSEDAQVEALFIGGRDYLGREEDEFEEVAGVSYRKRDREMFEDTLATQMLVPRRLLNIVYSRSVRDLDTLSIPGGFKVHRPG